MMLMMIDAEYAFYVGLLFGFLPGYSLAKFLYQRPGPGEKVGTDPHPTRWHG